MCRVIDRVIAALEQGTDFLAQFQETAVCRIGGIALLEAVDTAFADRPGSDEVRLADAEGDDIFHFGCDIEEAADAGGSDGIDCR